MLRTRSSRQAFTLIEVLVVIAILVILMSLTLVVMSKIWRTIDVTATTHDIAKLQEGCERFKSAFGRYPQARIALCETPAGWAAMLASADPRLRQLAEESMEYLAAVFPGIELNNTNTYVDPVSGLTMVVGSHDWAGRWQHQAGVLNNFTGNIPSGQGGAVFVLEGEEALVYFTGGMRYGLLDPNNPQTAKDRTVALGWSSAKQRPCASPPLSPSGPARLGPYFDFVADRVQYSYYNPTVNGLPQYNAAPGPFSSLGWFPVYTDRFGMPYAFFRARSGGGNTNNYAFPGTQAIPIGGTPAYLYDVNVMMTSLGSPQFVPYWTNITPPQPANTIVPPPGTQATFCKADRFQIISAGRDKKFGTGGRLDPAKPEQYLSNPDDLDNITNCTEGQIKP